MVVCSCLMFFGDVFWCMVSLERMFLVFGLVLRGLWGVDFGVWFRW